MIIINFNQSNGLHIIQCRLKNKSSFFISNLLLPIE